MITLPDLYAWTPPDDNSMRFCCFGADIGGPTRCTCWEPVWDVPRRELFNRSAPAAARVEMCDGCAYRPGTDAWTCRTEGDLPADTAKRFYCHDGARRIVAWVHPDGNRVDLTTDEIDHCGDEEDGRPFDHDGNPSPFCAGWATRYPVRLAVALLREDMHVALVERYA